MRFISFIKKIMNARRRHYRNRRKRSFYYQPEDHVGFRESDAKNNRVFRCYVLDTDYGLYAGHNGNLHARLSAHMNDEVKSTAGGNPRLMWKSYPLKSREASARFEVALKSLRDSEDKRFTKYTNLVPRPFRYH